MLQIIVSPTPLRCSAFAETEHVTLDLGSAREGTFALPHGYPLKPDLASFQARAEACPAKTDAGVTCHKEVRSGQAVITHLDPNAGGLVQGTFDITFADGTLSASFTAVRCN